MIGKLLGALIPEPWRIPVLILVGVAVFAAIDRRATWRERARCDAAAIASQLKVVTADRDAARKAEAAAKAHADAIAIQKQKTEADHEKLKLAFAGRCLATPDDLRRLR